MSAAPKTQRERFEELLTEMKVTFTSEGAYVTIDQGKGYLGFCCSVEFDEKGNMKSYGCWE
jgi:hypothetical protein